MILFKIFSIFPKCYLCINAVFTMHIDYYKLSVLLITCKNNFQLW